MMDSDNVPMIAPVDIQADDELTLDPQSNQLIKVRRQGKTIWPAPEDRSAFDEEAFSRMANRA